MTCCYWLLLNRAIVRRSPLCDPAISPTVVVRTTEDRSRGHLRKRGDAWELRAYAGRDPVSNRELYRTRTFRGGKREAERALGKFVQEVADRGPEARDATVGALVSRWFDLAKADLSPSTVRGYERTIRRYIEPALGEVPLDRLQVAAYAVPERAMKRANVDIAVAGDGRRILGHPVVSHGRCHSACFHSLAHSRVRRRAVAEPDVRHVASDRSRL